MHEYEYEVLKGSRFTLYRRGFIARLFTLARPILLLTYYNVNIILRSKKVTIMTTFIKRIVHKSLILIQILGLVSLICTQMYLYKTNKYVKGAGVSGIWSLSSPYLLTECQMLSRGKGGMCKIDIPHKP